MKHSTFEEEYYGQLCQIFLIYGHKYKNEPCEQTGVDQYNCQLDQIIRLSSD